MMRKLTIDFYRYWLFNNKWLKGIKSDDPGRNSCRKALAKKWSERNVLPGLNITRFKLRRSGEK